MDHHYHSPNYTRGTYHYNYVCEALATGEYVYSFVNGKINPADILSKHWAHKDVWPLIRTLLFWKGDTLEQFKPSD